MINHGFDRSPYDSCVYHQQLSDGSYYYLLLYMDDIMIAARDMKVIQKLKADLNIKFEMKDLGQAKKILGMEIIRDR